MSHESMKFTVWTGLQRSDSGKIHFSKVDKYFSYFSCQEATPSSLCFSLLVAVSIKSQTILRRAVYMYYGARELFSYVCEQEINKKLCMAHAVGSCSSSKCFHEHNMFQTNVISIPRKWLHHIGIGLFILTVIRCMVKSVRIIHKWTNIQTEEKSEKCVRVWFNVCNSWS